MYKILRRCFGSGSKLGMNIRVIRLVNVQKLKVENEFLVL